MQRSTTREQHILISTTATSALTDTDKPTLPLYTVGPATSRTLHTLSTPTPPCLAHLQPKILGANTGNGDNLARFILSDYPQHSPTLRPLLFLVGETRRAIIPNTLSSATPPIPLTELEVYSTLISPTFRNVFASLLISLRTLGHKRIVIAVFSPQCCDAMLEVLRKRAENERGGKSRYYLATIGPTTREYLASEFGVEADVVAGRPSPEGLADGVRALLESERASEGG